jgi:hypothetical protein
MNVLLASQGDLTPQEQSHVRAALQFLRRRCNGWVPLAAALGFKRTTLSAVAHGHKPVSPTLLIRVAKFAGVTMDDVATGRFPAPGTCPHCGHHEAEAFHSQPNG